MSVDSFPYRNGFIEYLKIGDHHGRYIGIAFYTVGIKNVKSIDAAKVKLTASTFITAIHAEFIILKPVAYCEIPCSFCAGSKS